MSDHPIELEIRGEIAPKDIPGLRKRLLGLGYKPVSTTRRTMVMSFGTVSASGLNWDEKKKDEVDVRCRVTNGKAEVVAKIGRTSANNRVEVSVPVPVEEMLKFAQLFGAMPLFTKAGSRHTENFKKGTITVSLVSSIPSKLSYIEIERMTTREKETKDLVVLRALAKELGITLWETHQQYIDFCSLLTKTDDWAFEGSAADMKKLKADIKKTKSDRA